MVLVGKNPRTDGEYLNSLARGLSVLRAFTREKPEMTLSEISAQTQLNPAVVRRCLNTLQHLGYVGKKDKLFLLRPEVFRLGAAYIESMNLEEIIRPSLQRIRDNTGYSIALAVLSDMDVLFLVHVSTRQLTRIVAGVGTRFPVYATSAGRVLMAFQEQEVQESYLQNASFEALTDKTVTTKKEFQDILQTVKKAGYASIDGELDIGVVSVSVPVFSDSDNIIAAISCSTASAKTTEEEMTKEILGDLLEAAKEIEFEIRRSPMLAHSITY